jgi:hypothetical protein
MGSNYSQIYSSHVIQTDAMSNTGCSIPDVNSNTVMFSGRE